MSNVKIWRYRLPKSKFDQGGVVILDETGLFCAVTDFGNYSYWWPWGSEDRAREDFRSFIAGICDKKYPDYILGKLAKKTELDAPAVQRWLKLITFQHWKAHERCKRRKCEKCEGPVYGVWRPHSGCGTTEFNNDWMRKTLKQISDIQEKHDLSEFSGFSRLLFDLSDCPNLTYDSHTMFFAKELLPRLAKCIQDDLASESSSVDLSIA